MIFFNQLKVPTIKFGKCFAEFMIPKALLKKLDNSIKFDEESWGVALVVIATPSECSQHNRRKYVVVFFFLAFPDQHSLYTKSQISLRC